uniref:ATP synthase complex subunit 8 n=1 Tax=Dryococelus australis TaxID=614101 RepID=A0A348AYD2_9NEOP|nr:ATP synthase F0 subunit 8 [Dryococelus australis]
MPQMSPMSWMLIYIYIIMTFMLFIMKIYFFNKPMINNKTTNLKLKNENNWKW